MALSRKAPDRPPFHLRFVFSTITTGRSNKWNTFAKNAFRKKRLLEQSKSPWSWDYFNQLPFSSTFPSDLSSSVGSALACPPQDCEFDSRPRTQTMLLMQTLFKCADLLWGILSRGRRVSEFRRTLGKYYVGKISHNSNLRRPRSLCDAKYQSTYQFLAICNVINDLLLQVIWNVMHDISMAVKLCHYSITFGRQVIDISLDRVEKGESVG